MGGGELLRRGRWEVYSREREIAVVGWGGGGALRINVWIGSQLHPVCLNLEFSNFEENEKNKNRYFCQKLWYIDLDTFRSFANHTTMFGRLAAKISTTIHTK